MNNQLVFRALALRDEFFTMRPQYAPDVNFKIEWGRKEMIQIVMRWTAVPSAKKHASNTAFLFWQYWFGHKDFAVLSFFWGKMKISKMMFLFNIKVITSLYPTG